MTTSAARAVCVRHRNGPGHATWVPSGTIQKCYGATGAKWCIDLAIGRTGPPVHCTAVRVDQVIPSLAEPRRNRGQHALNLRNGLRSAGIDSDIFYGCCTPDFAHLGQPLVELGRAGHDRWLLYQAAIGSPVFDVLAARSEPKLVNYHNIARGALLRLVPRALRTSSSSAVPSSSGWHPETASIAADSAFDGVGAPGRGSEGRRSSPLLDRHVRLERWPPRPRCPSRAWTRPRRAPAAQTCSSWARSRPTRRRTTS